MKKISVKNLILNAFIAFAILFVCSAPFIASHVAYAEGEIKSYYYIKQNTILIPEGQKINGNIQLNSTYYVEATGNPDVVINDITYRYVIYNGITGLVPSSALSKKSINNVTTPFFISNSKLTAYSEKENDLLMFFNINSNKTECQKLKNNDKLDFIAYSENGTYILAKLADSTVGYVPKNFCSPTIIYTPNPNPINPDNETSLPGLTPDNPTAPTTSINKATITRVVLIITLCVVVVVVIFLLFKPTSKKKKSSVDDFYDF